MVILAANNIYKKYGNVQVLQGIDLEIRKGEITSIVGASGAGKSTLLHILGTLDQPDSGTVTLLNKPIHNITPQKLAALRNQHLGFVFQFHNLLPEFTALENVCMPQFLLNNNTNNRTAIEQRATELLDLLEVSHRKTHKPSELSGGEQQRVAVARALMNQPDVILADEPSGNLDGQRASELHQLFFRLRKDFGQTFVIVTHNAELANMADRKIELKEGKILC
jgi:lipoprotein-releasing system ATP-binding protein